MAASDDVRVAREFFAGEFEDWPRSAIATLTEDVVITTSSGILYVGHAGWARWYADVIRTSAVQRFGEVAAESLGRGWVLLRGEVNTHRRDGEQVRQPGAWLVRVRDSEIASLLYFRTEDAAREALADVIVR